MAVNVLRGPAGAGKDAWIRENFPDALLADVTLLWAAATGAVRDASGRYPDRLEGDGLRASLYLKAVLIGFRVAGGHRAMGDHFQFRGGGGSADR